MRQGLCHQGLEGSCKVSDLDPEHIERSLQVFKQICIVKRLFWLPLGERQKQGDQRRQGSEVWVVWRLRGMYQEKFGR